MAGLKLLLDPTRKGSEAQALEENLQKRIVGQDHAIKEIVDLYQTFQAGMATPGRPAGVLLFLGPTGSGKTRTVEALAESLVGDPRAIVKIDCAEYQHSHEIAKLIGSPPGYLGHRETRALLSQETLDHFHTDTIKLSFVLFDEIEKASDALWNLLLGVLDKATLTLGDNRQVDFSRSLIFMTSNLGAAEMNSILHPTLGFAAGAVDSHPADKIARTSEGAARRKFTPEFMNRIDKICVFHPLGDAELRRILELELKGVEERLRIAGAKNVRIKVSGAAKEFLLKEGVDARYGARHLKRAIERLMVHPVSNLIATAQLQSSDKLFVECDPRLNRLVFLKEFEATEPQGGPVTSIAAA